jgi:hypothetical protein
MASVSSAVQKRREKFPIFHLGLDAGMDKKHGIVFIREQQG